MKKFNNDGIFGLINELYFKRQQELLECNCLIIGGKYLEEFRIGLWKLYNITMSEKDNRYLDMLIIQSKNNILEIAE